MREDMEGRTCLVTGATDGIGKVTARRLAQAGAEVWIVGRDAEKTAAVVAELGREPTAGAVRSQVADLSSMAEVRDLASRIRDGLGRLDVLINNVGALFRRRELTAEGFERTFALNHLGPLLLTRHLLPLLRASSPARIVQVASEAHRGAAVDFANLQGEKSYRAFRAYQVSKLENVLTTYELAERLAGSGVTANALHPGFVASRFGHGAGGVLALLIRALQALFAIGVEEGAETSVFLATSPEVAGVTGRYFEKGRERASSPASHDPETRRRLWRVSEELLSPYLPAADR